MKGNDIMTTIESLKSNFNRCNSDSTKDQIKQFLVLPLIQHLGWEIFDPNEVDPDYPAQIGGYPPHYETIDCVLKNGNKKVFIMIKKKMKSYEERLPDYYQENELDLLLLTNGTIWRFYSINEDIFQGKFYEIDMSQESFEFGMSIFELFLSKENIENGEALKKAMLLYKKKVLSELFTKEQDEFIKLFPNINHHNDFLFDMIRDGVSKKKVWHEFIRVFLKDDYLDQNIKDELQHFDIEEEEIEESLENHKKRLM